MTTAKNTLPSISATRELVKREADSFFEWPTDASCVVSTVSMLLFAEHIAAALTLRIAELEAALVEAHAVGAPIRAKKAEALADTRLAQMQEDRKQALQWRDRAEKAETACRGHEATLTRLQSDLLHERLKKEIAERELVEVTKERNDFGKSLSDRVISETMLTALRINGGGAEFELEGGAGLLICQRGKRC